jgi:Flp pilus assembly protein TadG
MQSTLANSVKRALLSWASSARAQWYRFVHDDKGAAIVYFAVLPVLIGAAALGIEGGQLYSMKRQLQGAADAAALAGSVDSVAGRASSITADAKYEAQRYGFTDGSNGVTISVNTPPTSGSNANTTGAVEVIITKATKFSLGAVLINWLGGTNNGFNIVARSVAAQGSTSTSATSYEACIVALTTDTEQGVSFTNFNNFTSDCTIATNAKATGSGANASVDLSTFNTAALNNIWTRGSLSTSTYSKISYLAQDAPYINQQSYVADPYAKLGVPSPPAGCNYTNFNAGKGSSVTLTPGTYCGGVSIDNAPNNVYLTAGTYYILDGDFYVASVNNVSCTNCVDGVSGVTIVLTTATTNYSNIGGFFVNSDNNVTLSAPPTGTYKGILVYQDPRVPNGTMTTNAKIFSVISLNNAKLSGAIYFPNNRIDISNINNFGGNSSNGCTIWVGRYIKFQSFNNNYKGGCSTFGTTPIGVTTTKTTVRNKVFE